MSRPRTLGPVGAAADAVAKGLVSAELLVSRSVERIEALNGDLNAVSTLDIEGAMNDANSFDRDQRGGALAGLPLLVKDTEDAAGLATTFASMLYQHAGPAQRDSAAVSALRGAGSIVLGKANCSEYAWEGHSWNQLNGASRNPWDLERSPGGSSGGSAAAISSGMVPLATATDAGGSVRTPAAQCGLLGLKPSNGLWTCGEVPGALDQLTPGILASHPSDLELIFNVMSNSPMKSPAWTAFVPVLRVELRRRLVGTDELDQAVADAWAALEAPLSELASVIGATFDVVEAPIFADSQLDEDAFTSFALDLRSFLGRDIIAQNSADLDPSIVHAMAAVESMELDDYLELRRRRLNFRDLADSALESTLVVTPTLTVAGIHADGSMVGMTTISDSLPQSVTNTNMHNWTGHPALSVPAGFLTTGHPFGIQFTLTRWQDRQLLNLAQLWYEIHPWPMSAPGFAPFWSIE
jgi:Asp-tRNA(Asn)/Glu-tRNA(Gln) amidotransferase A subunit family amidase